MYTIIPFSEKHKNDLGRLAQDLRNFVTHLDGRLDERLVYDVREEVEESIEENKKGENILFLCEDDGKIYGYILAKIKNEDWKGTALKKYGKIEELYVDPEYRGKGASTALMNTVEQYLKDQNIEYMELSVMAGNLRARSFYEKMGLKEYSITLAKRL